MASTLSCSFAQRNGPSRRRAPKDTLRKSQRRCTVRACRLHREMARRRQKCSRTLQMASRRRQEQKALCTRKQRPSFLSNNASRIRLPLSRPYNHSRPNDSASEIRWAPPMILSGSNLSNRASAASHGWASCGLHSVSSIEIDRDKCSNKEDCSDPPNSFDRGSSR